MVLSVPGSSDSFLLTPRYGARGGIHAWGRTWRRGSCGPAGRREALAAQRLLPRAPQTLLQRYLHCWVPGALTAPQSSESFCHCSGPSHSQRAVPPFTPWLPESSGLGAAGRHIVVTRPHPGSLETRHRSVLTVCSWHQCCWARASFEPGVWGREGKRWRGRSGELV